MQAGEDIKAAITSMQNGHYEWTCFQSQQSAEKSLKALLLVQNIEAWGHGLVHLLQKWRELNEEKKEENQEIDNTEHQDLVEKCQELDRHYIQSRNHNEFNSGYLAEYYNQKTANTCIIYAKIINSFVKKEVTKISTSE